MYRRVLSFLMVLVVLSVLIFFFSCSLSPRLTKVPTNEGSIADTTPPSVTITFPTNGQILFTNEITITGTASDEGSGVKEVWLSVNGDAYGKVNGTTSWSTNVTVNYGSNTISVYAVDNSNNVSATNTVSFVVGDTNKPSVSITTPTEGQVLYDNSITVSGTASDVGSGVKEVWLSVNGGSYGKVNGTTSWSTNVTVNYGNNTIRVYAVDNSNNVSATNTVSFVVGDTNKPSVSITTPTEGQVLYDNSITVSGTASDVGSGVKEVLLSVNGGGFGKVNGTTSWSTNVTVDYGSNTIRVYAVDNLNNVSTTNTVSVFRDYVVFVSTGGSDANSGGISDPFRSINVAMGHISANITDLSVTVKVKVGSGVYTPGSGLSSSGSGFVINRHNIVISGGWNNDFSSVVGKSELDGNNDLYHVVMITNVTNVRLENLVIRKGNANGSDPDDRGGGIYVSNVSYLVIESSVVISNNNANNYGGGLYLDRSPNTTISGSVYGNSAAYGGGLYLDRLPNTTISGSVYGNRANNDGGGLYLSVSPNTMISGSVYGNSAIYDGGGVYLWYSTNNTINGSVYSNNADWGGGVYLWYSTSNTISGSVYGNSANQYGGGVFLWSSDYFTNTGWITNNNAGISGGGVYKFGSYYSYFGNVSGNYPDDIAP
jgi:parallel beta-helix repeat protein